MTCFWCMGDATHTVVLEPGKPVTRAGRKSYKPEKTVPACEDHANHFSNAGLEVRRDAPRK